MSENYFKTWYVENAESLNNKRRDRYHTDPEYRDSVLKRNRESRERRKQAQEKLRERERQAVRLRASPNPWKAIEKEIEINGQKVKTKLYTIGAVARAIGRSVQAVRLWESQGILPETEYRTAKQDRLYTEEQIDSFVAQLRAQGKLGNPARRKSAPRGLLRTVACADGSVCEVRMYRVGVMAKLVGRTVVTLEQMELNGILPRTPYRSSSKVPYRLYTLEMINVVKEAFEELGGEIRGEEGRKRFHNMIAEAWTKQNVWTCEIKDEGNAEAVSE